MMSLRPFSGAFAVFMIAAFVQFSPLVAQNDLTEAGEPQQVETNKSPAVNSDPGVEDVEVVRDTSGNEVLVVRLEDKPIVAATELFMMSRLDTAEEKGIPYLLVIDTPGGAVDTTRAIVRRLLGAKVPVLVMVGPSGARAGSAGVFITMAANIAAMAPGTNIGAAHPIGAGVGAPAQDDSEDGQRAARSEEEVLAEKIENDLVAFAESIAKVRNRNEEWAISAVRDSASVTADRALELGVVDLISPTVEDFLRQIDGRTVETANGPVELRTAGAKLVEKPMSLRETLQTKLGDPNIAYLLMSLGVMGIVLELYNPGMMVGAIFGGICLVLSAASGLPFNIGGLLLLGAAGVLFVLEVYITSYGLLSIAGAICMVLGGIFLFETVPGLPNGTGFEPQVGLEALALVGVCAAIFAAILAFVIGKALRRKPVGGQEGLAGKVGKVVLDFGPTGGKVLVNGEFWDAQCEAPVVKGDQIRVVAVEGLRLTVEPTGQNI